MRTALLMVWWFGAFILLDIYGSVQQWRHGSAFLSTRETLATVYSVLIILAIVEAYRWLKRDA